MTIWTSDTAKAAIRQAVIAAGFDDCGFASVDEPWPASARLEEFIARGRHGQMAWMAVTQARRAHPRALWPQARSAIAVGDRAIQLSAHGQFAQEARSH